MTAPWWYRPQIRQPDEHFFIILWVTYRNGLDDASSSNGALDQAAMKTFYIPITGCALRKQHHVVIL